MPSIPSKKYCNNLVLKSFFAGEVIVKLTYANNSRYTTRLTKLMFQVAKPNKMVVKHTIETSDT